MLLGDLAGMGSAALWAFTSLILARSSRRMPALAVSSVRLLYGTAFYALVVPLTGNLNAVVRLGAGTAFALAASALLSLGLGDTLYIAGMHRIGVSRASPISVTVYPLLTVALAWLLIGEKLSMVTVLGGVLVLIGILLVVVRPACSGPEAVELAAVPASHSLGQFESAEDSSTSITPVGIQPKTPRREPPLSMTGLLLVLAATVAWALSTVWLKTLTSDANAIVVGAVRVPITAAFLAGAAASRGMHRLDRYRRSDLALIGVAGIVGSGVGTMLYVYALAEVGAGRASLLNSLSPVFALPLAALFLSERITRLMVLGTALALAGTWLFVA